MTLICQRRMRALVEVSGQVGPEGEVSVGSDSGHLGHALGQGFQALHPGRSRQGIRRRVEA
jgi:hypothetical protein